MVSSSPRGAVIGAGIAGTVVTHALRRAGYTIELYERAPEARSSGYQLNVLANGKYALSQLGLLEPLMASGFGATMKAMSIVDGVSGRELRRLRTTYSDDSGFCSTSFYRGHLHHALLKSMAGPGPQGDKELARLSQRGGVGPVTIDFTDGDSQTFDFIVGADGCFSSVRDQIFPDHPDPIVRFTALLFAAEPDLDGKGEAERGFAEQVRRGEFTQLGAPGTAVVLSHAGSGRFGIIIACLDATVVDGVKTAEDAKTVARSLVKRIRDPRIHHAIDIGFWDEESPLVWRIADVEPLPSYSKGAVTLLGDAAHGMIPIVGQGGNQSFEDAWVLARELSSPEAAPNARSLVSALRRYSDGRSQHVARIQKEARRRAQGAFAKSGLGFALNNAILRLLPQRLFDSFDNHILKYAIADPACPIQRIH